MSMRESWTKLYVTGNIYENVPARIFKYFLDPTAYEKMFLGITSPLITNAYELLSRMCYFQNTMKRESCSHEDLQVGENVDQLTGMLYMQLLKAKRTSNVRLSFCFSKSLVRE